MRDTACVFLDCDGGRHWPSLLIMQGRASTPTSIQCAEMRSRGGHRWAHWQAETRISMQRLRPMTELEGRPRPGLSCRPQLQCRSALAASARGAGARIASALWVPPCCQWLVGVIQIRGFERPRACGHSKCTTWPMCRDTPKSVRSMHPSSTPGRVEARRPTSTV